MARALALVLLAACGGDPEVDATENEGTATPRSEQEHRFRIRVDEFCGYIDATGEVVIPLRYYEANDFSDGRAFATTDAEYDRWGVIDPEGNWVVEPTFEECMYFSEGIAGVKVDGLWGAIDLDGEWAFEPKFQGKIGPFLEGRATVFLPSGEVSVIDPKGEEIFRVPKVPLFHAFSEGLLFAEHPGGKLRAHDVDGEVAFEVEGVDMVFEFSGGLAMASTEAGWGYLTPSGAWAIEPQYRSTESFTEGIAAVEDHQKRWTYIDTSGARLFDREWTEDLEPFSEGLALVHSPEHGKWGYIDRTGAWVIEPRFGKPKGTRFRFRNGLARVDLIGERGLEKRVYIDRKGEVVWRP